VFVTPNDVDLDLVEKVNKDKLIGIIRLDAIVRE
jgi:hypothetical protein